MTQYRLHRPLLIGPRRIEVLEFRPPSAAAMRAAEARDFPADDFDGVLLAISLTTGIDEATLDRQLSARDYCRLSQGDYSQLISDLVKGG